MGIRLACAASARAIPKVEALRMQEPSACVVRKATPVECVQYGIDVDKARFMSPNELTNGDLVYLLDNGIPSETIFKVYGISIKSCS